jgi:membrane protein DedA with SNARE-associated domain
MRAFLHQLNATLLAYGPAGIFVLAIIDSVGIPLPAAIDAMLIGVGAASAHAPSRAYLAAALAVIGSLIGNSILFQGVRHGRRLFTAQEPPPGKRKKFQAWFHRYGMLTVFIPAVTPVVPLPLKVFVISAGALRTPFSRFLLVLFVARVIRYFGEAYLAVRLGEDAEGFLTRNGWTLAGVALGLAFALFFLIRAADRRKTQETSLG